MAADSTKNNAQFDLHYAQVQAVQSRVSAALQAHPLVQMAMFGCTFTSMMLSRYRTGQRYGVHVDNVWQSSMRIDIACTLFLSNTASYDGGDLRLHDHAGVQDFKLAAGSLLLYPASALHEMCEVKSGERLAAVRWIDSHIKNHERRSVLFDLNLLRQRLHQSGDIAGYQTLSRIFGVPARQSH